MDFTGTGINASHAKLTSIGTDTVALVVLEDRAGTHLLQYVSASTVASGMELPALYLALLAKSLSEDSALALSECA